MTGAIVVGAVAGAKLATDADIAPIITDGLNRILESVPSKEALSDLGAMLKQKGGE